MKRQAARKKTPQVEIREMEIDDLPAVFHMGEQLFTARDVPNLYRTWDEFEVIELFLGDTEFCLVGECEENIVGFALGTTISKARSAWKYGHLVWLGVHPDFQKYGIAGRLFRQLRTLMEKEGVRILFVDTEADNMAAVGFFQKMGFDTGEEHVYLSVNLANHKSLRDGKKGMTRKRPSAKPKRGARHGR